MSHHTSGVPSGKNATGPFVSTPAITPSAPSSDHAVAADAESACIARTTATIVAVVNMVCVGSSMLFTVAHVTIDGSSHSRSGHQSYA